MISHITDQDASDAGSRTAPALGGQPFRPPDRESVGDLLGRTNVTNESPCQAERALRAIMIMRGHRVILDSDLAVPHGVETRRLNEQVRRNRSRFPSDFAFQVTS